MSFKVVYVPIGVPTFHLESAQDQFEKSVKMIEGLTNSGIYPDAPLLTIDDLKKYLHGLKADLIILQNTTFANSAYASEVLKKFDCPILLWTLREPVIDGGRLRLNSLTGAYSAGNLFHHLGREKFGYVFGSPEEAEVISTTKAYIEAAKLKKSLKSLNMASIGHTPQGFGFGRALDAELLKNFGINLLSVEARELMSKARELKDEELIEVLEEAKQKMVGLMELPENNVKDFARIYKAYKDFIEANNVKAIASRCWPDFFIEFKTPVCGALGLLNDNLIAAACESDLMGALSMYMGVELTKKAVFFGDPVSLDETKNTVTFWHCGMAACSLANKSKGAETGVHPNRKIGPTMEFGCKGADEVTIFRVGRKPNGEFRFFIASGEALDEPKQFLGASVVVKTDSKALELVKNSVKDGWEPHFVVVYGNVAKELEVLAELLNLEVCKY
ncbi:MAG: hypothetical protein ACRDA0_14110 [Cetobacterium sp.]|uniref:hypothetical protein n=1 Tax=Cetobacterium sp. TaxID=2071632 RepID=UPI003F393935